LDSVGDRYALATFSGETEKNVNFHFIKEFDSDYNLMVRNAIGSVKPLQQNRDGAGVRHATRVLSQQPERTKLLFYLMEGVPHDYEYKDEYAIEDTKRSLIEAKQRNCIPIVLAFGQGIDDRVRSLADHTVYREVSNPKSVPEMLPDLYRKIAF
jgi:nitric oxide reductase NorD protein